MGGRNGFGPTDDEWETRRALRYATFGCYSERAGERAWQGDCRISRSLWGDIGRAWVACLGLDLGEGLAEGGFSHLGIASDLRSQPVSV